MSKNRPKVLHCISHFALGGAERVALAIMSALKSEFDFSVYAVRGLADNDTGRALLQRCQRDQIPVFMGPRIPMRWGGMISGAAGLQRAVNQSHPDLIHQHCEIPESSYALWSILPGANRAIPVIRTIHNSRIWRFAPTLGHWCDRRLERAHCIAVSQSAAQEVYRLRQASQAAPFATPPQVIYNGVSPGPLRKPPRDESAPLKVIFGGRLEHEKGADLIPEIIRRTRLPDHRRAELKIYGEGEFGPILREFCQHPPLGWSIEIIPPVSDFPDRLAQSDVMIVPSRFEGLGLVSIEASFAGLPVVAARAPGLTETLPENYPWLAPLDDPSGFADMLSQALQSAAIGEHHNASARHFVARRFKQESMVSAYRLSYFQTLPPHLAGDHAKAPDFPSVTKPA